MTAKGMQVTRIIFMLIYIPLVLVWISCGKNQPSGTSGKSRQVARISMSLNQGEMVLSEWIDSIRFLPLGQRPDFLSANPDKIEVKGEYIIYLACRDAGDCKLGVFNLAGESLFQLVSSPDIREPISTISDFDLVGDTLHVLHDTRLSLFHAPNFKKIGDDISLPEWYHKVMKVRDGYITYNSTGTHALNFLTHSGELNGRDWELSRYPNSIADLFQHFSNIYQSKDKHFYINFEPDIYRLSFDSKKLEKILEMDLGPWAVTSEDLKALISAGNEIGRVSNQLFGEQKKFLIFNLVCDLKDRMVLTFKMNSRKYYVFYDKNRGKSYMFDRVYDDSGYLFLMYGSYLSDYTGFSDDQGSYIVLVLDAEHIYPSILDFDERTVMIPSNLSEVAHLVTASSNPVLALLKLKDMR